MKRCRSCSQTKPLAEFYRHRRKADGHASNCKTCERKARQTPEARERSRAFGRSDKAKANKRRYRERHRDRIRREESEFSQRRRARLQERIDAIKLERGCIDCGYRLHPRALDFDHRDGEDKTFNVSKILRQTVSWERIQAEIDKCDVRCANCHRVRTAEGNHYTNTNEHKVRRA